MEFLIKAGQLILSLSILVTLHELGHFVPARLFGTRVEKFFLFFDWKFALWKRKIGDTVFGIGWIPLGGYVKISGMIDESMDKEQKERLRKPPEPWEFRAKPVWQRLVVMLGGVTVNATLGFLIYALVMFTWGREYIALDKLPYGIDASALMERQGFRDGDRIVEMPGFHPRTVGDVSIAMLIDDARHVVVERADGRHDILLPATIHDSIMESGDKLQLGVRIPFFIDSVMPGTCADSARSFRRGDRVLAVDGAPTPFFGDFVSAVGARKGGRVEVMVAREGHQVHIPVNVDAEGRVGLKPRPLDSIPAMNEAIVRERYGLLSSIPAGLSFGWEQLRLNVVSFKLLFRRSGVKQMGGLGSMAKAYGAHWDWQHFWQTTAFLSFALAFLNVLPIPALDGGHVVFLLYEWVARRPAPQKVLEYAQMAGMVFLLTVIVAVNGHDIYKWITNSW